MDAYGLLRLQIEWGADEALEDAAVDRLRAPAPSRNPPAAAPPAIPPNGLAPAVSAQAGAAAGSAADRATAAAAQAHALEALKAAIAAFDGCGLRDTATHLVFAAGDPGARVLLIGDPPNADDDRSGTPFAGTDGQWLDTMLAGVGLDRGRLLLTPLLPWRPPGERPATAAEVTACLPFLHRLIALTRPRCLVLAGAQAVRAMLGARPRMQGGTRKVECTIPGIEGTLEGLLLPFPASALRQPAAKREAWACLRRIRRILDA